MVARTLAGRGPSVSSPSPVACRGPAGPAPVQGQPQAVQRLGADRNPQGPTMTEGPAGGSSLSMSRKLRPKERGCWTGAIAGCGTVLSSGFAGTTHSARHVAVLRNSGVAPGRSQTGSEDVQAWPAQAGGGQSAFQCIAVATAGRQARLAAALSEPPRKWSGKLRAIAWSAVLAQVRPCSRGHAPCA